MRRAVRTTHGQSKSREYKSWQSAKTRCYSPTYRGYANYGGRGIKMCDAWRNNSVQFLRDMGACPPGYSLDRIDINGHYEPGNCRWADARTQHGNTRYNRLLEFRGEQLPATVWARRLKMAKNVLFARLRNGWPIEKALTRPVASHQFSR